MKNEPVKLFASHTLTMVREQEVWGEEGSIHREGKRGQKSPVPGKGKANQKPK